MPQLADDPARNLRNIWIGFNDVRLPDARYTAWGLAIGLYLVGCLVFWLVLPVGIGVAVLLYAGAGYVEHRVRRRHLQAGRWSFRTRHTLFALTLAFVLLLIPNVRVWAYPLPWWLVWLPAALTAFMVTRRVMPYIDGNRPVSYWMHALAQEMRAPRPTPDLTEYAELLAAPDDVIDMDELRYDALATEEYDMALYREKKPLIEAERWLPNDKRSAAAFLAWLAGHGLHFAVIDHERGLQVDVIDWTTVRPGQWLTFLPANSRRARVRDVVAMSDQDFRAMYERAVEEVSA